MVRMLAPGRRYPVIGDTHYRARPRRIWAEILADRYGPRYAGLLEEVQGKKLAEAGSEYALWYRDPDLKAESDAALPLHTEWFPGWHVAVLRGGEPDGDMAFYLNGYARHGHRHYDTLGITLLRPRRASWPPTAATSGTTPATPGPPARWRTTS